MNVGELKRYIDNIEEHVPVVGIVTVEQGLGSCGGTDDDPKVHLNWEAGVLELSCCTNDEWSE